MKNNDVSAFVLSLDFELLWGVYESRGSEYYPAIERVFQVVPRLLELFERHEIRCTWATVGALFLKNKAEFEELKPNRLPQYENQSLSPYKAVNQIYALNPKLLFAPELVELIMKTSGQELGAHTFAHYYALEPGASIEDFRLDLEANVAAASPQGVSLRSFVFPRNQFNPAYLEVCQSAGFSAYRGNPDHWAYRASKGRSLNILKRAFRLVDAYLPISGHLTHSSNLRSHRTIYNVAASLFFRAYSPKLRLIEFLKIKRIKFSMSYAAKKGRVFHLWWHPHNFSENLEKNLKQLEEIIQHFMFLKAKHGMKSMNMKDVVELQERLHG
jgi:peptidoglycan/xylan/chitin deacetylase (PgdA/CDA1 family)